MTTSKILTKNDRFFVNSLTGKVELRVVGSFKNMEKRVRAVFAALPAGSFTPAPKATWRHYVDCNVRGGTDAYEVVFAARNAAAVEAALRSMVG